MLSGGPDKGRSGHSPAPTAADLGSASGRGSGRRPGEPLRHSPSSAAASHQQRARPGPARLSPLQPHLRDRYRALGGRPIELERVERRTSAPPPNAAKLFSPATGRGWVQRPTGSADGGGAYSHVDCACGLRLRTFIAFSTCSGLAGGVRSHLETHLSGRPRKYT